MKTDEEVKKDLDEIIENFRKVDESLKRLSQQRAKSIKANKILNRIAVVTICIAIIALIVTFIHIALLLMR